MKVISEDEDILVGIEINIIDSETGLKKCRLHRYVFEKEIPFKEYRKYVKEYLRFELKGEWFHIKNTGEWTKERKLNLWKTI